MRPVRLELNGFASFRDPAVVDFTDTDYFALVGPTGSGKSTVLDAMTFALYGTAARWGSRTAISYALAPTSNRCTVALTFDIGAQRYQVAREVRRVGKNIQQKAVSLVRVIEGAEPEVLAGEIKELNAAVENLLGLSFEDFCQCVVLPQGEFAKFLTASSADRQRILLKLLGADHYEGVGKRAGSLAATAAQEVEILTDQLGRQADITPDRLTAAEQRVAELADVAVRVEEAVAQIVVARDAAASSSDAAARARTEAAALSAVRMPDGIGDLQSGLDAAQLASTAARRHADSAGQALTDATAAAQNGPQHATLEVVQARYAERDRLTERRAEVDLAAVSATTELSHTAEQAAAAEKSVDQARTELEQARETYAEVRDRSQNLQSRRDRLAAVKIPSNVTDLADRVSAARSGQVAALHVRLTAVDSLDQAREALSAAVGEAHLAAAETALESWAALGGSLAAARTAHQLAETAAQAAADEVARRRVELLAAQTELDNARVVAGAAQLRPTLTVGHSCPVCDQQVSTLPPPLSDPALDTAQRSLRDAAAAHEMAVTAHTSAAAEVAQTDRAVVRLLDQQQAADDRLRELLPDRPTGSDREPAADATMLSELTAARATLATAVTAAQTSLAAAERVVTETAAEVEALDREVTAARTHLATVRGSLTDLTPPAADNADHLDEAWLTLFAWAVDQRRTVSVELATAETAVVELEKKGRAARATLEAAEVDLRDANTAQRTAASAAGTATTARQTLHDRLAELDEQLVGAPAAADLPSLMAEAATLHREAQDAAAAATTARSAASTADEALRDWQQQLTRARAALTAARDAVAALEAPAVDPDDLVLGWSTLALWARQTAKQRAEAADAADTDARTQHERADLVLAEVEATLTTHGIEFQDLGRKADRAAQLVAVAVERVRGEAAGIRSKLAETADLQTKIAAADERQKVANQLAQLMRANKFPQWLAESALDTLVAGASESLRRLSNDQFDLTHRKGDFFVIDHSDADSERSVRTLSGGETFQASLALALSLSDHLAGMGGTTKLESIFLDEGFGTLDPDSLETVAATLENLAQGDRMVGVITHVGGLAERAPVRYRVNRDTRTSSIERETI